MPKILILDGARTPFCVWSRSPRPDGQPGGALARLDPFDLAAAALKAALEKSGVEPGRLDHVVFANCYHVGAHACYGGRYAALRAGVPSEITSTAVNLACGAGLEAVRNAAQEIALGRAGLAAACGADVPSQIDSRLFALSFKDISCGRPIAGTAQSLAAAAGFSRRDEDAWALESHRRALAARRRGFFKEEIVRMAETAEDDAILPEPCPDYFAAAKALYRDVPDATPANTHAVVDGGSALVLASERAAAGLKKPMGRFVGAALVGRPPERMAESAVWAVRKLLSQIGWRLEEVDLFELNETFASQTILDIKELGLDPGRVNPNGGALALGHPFAGTGGRLVLTLLKELRRRGQRRGVAAISIAGGMGIAAAVEAV